MLNVSHFAALQIIQETVGMLAAWANADFPSQAEQPQPEIQRAIQEAKKILEWSDGTSPAALKLVFDQIDFSSPSEAFDRSQTASHYRPAWALNTEVDLDKIHPEAKNTGLGEKTPRIPYATGDQPTEQDFACLKAQIAQAVKLLNPENLSQLMLFLEKFGSHVSFGASDIALVDQAKSAAAIAAALAQNPPDNKLALIGGDLMGVQKFIYTIASDGALKSLRARSFYLELATEEIVQQLLTALALPRTNVIYAGASKFYLLVAATGELKKTLEDIQITFNDWLLETFQRKVFLAIAYKSFPAEQLQTASNAEQTPLAQIWQRVNEKLNAQAFRKFSHQLDRVIKQQASHQPCKVCHRDDVPEEQLRRLNKLEDGSPLVCETCEKMFQLGDELPNFKALVRSPLKLDEDAKDQDIQIQIFNYCYRSVHPQWEPKNSDEIVFQINNWDLRSYSSDQFVPLLLGSYFQRSPETGGFIAANEMAEASEGIKRVGYLRMDVDRLSQIFSKGLGANYTLPRLASLSRQMTYFFKVYLNSLAAQRQPNFIDYCDSHTFQYLPRNPPKDPEKDSDKNLRKNLLFIYAGGDDLFVSGAWDEIVAFGFDVYQAFRAYTGCHPDITLSAGITIVDAKFPLYQAASEAGEAEDAAKENGRDSLSLFGEVLKWEQWLGRRKEEKNIDAVSREYLESETVVPDLQGVLPFVQDLLNPQALEFSYPQSFIRNLLITAQLREQKIKDTQKLQPAQIKAITYYLHLPKLAYALSRLPQRVQAHEDFKPIRQSLMSPRNSPYFRAIATWIEFLTR
jgi:CRISPR-associated protein Csm1